MCPERGVGRLLVVLLSLRTFPKDVCTSLHFFRGEAKDGWLGNEHAGRGRSRASARPNPHRRLWAPSNLGQKMRLQHVKLRKIGQARAGCLVPGSRGKGAVLVRRISAECTRNGTRSWFFFRRRETILSQNCVAQIRLVLLVDEGDRARGDSAHRVGPLSRAPQARPAHRAGAHRRLLED